MTYLDEAIETLPGKELAAQQLTKLHGMLPELWGRNQFYPVKCQAASVQPADIKSLDDLIGDHQTWALESHDYVRGL